MKLRIPMLLGAACLIQVLTTAPATAQDREGYLSSSVAVTYSDLDLTSQEGASAMLGRLRHAAERVCGRPSEMGLRHRRAARACADAALRDAVAATEAAAVQSVYAARADGLAAQPGRSIEIDTARARARVSYADLNLQSPEGRRALRQRINSVSRVTCGSNGIFRGLSRAQRACRDELEAETQVQIAAAIETQHAALAAPAASEAPPLMTASLASAPATPLEVADNQGVCDARVHTAKFAAGAASLSSGEHREVGFAVDSASVCNLDQVVVAVDSGDPLAQRRANATRAALIARGVSADRISVIRDADIDGAEVRMSFRGVAFATDYAQAETAQPGA